MVISLNIAKAN
jgi:hypothetical protein